MEAQESGDLRLASADGDGDLALRQSSPCPGAHSGDEDGARARMEGVRGSRSCLQLREDRLLIWHIANAIN